MNMHRAGASALACTDWRSWSSHHVAPLLERESERWLHEFHWDQRWSFTHVEAARESGRLPGLIATSPDGATHAWAFYLRRGAQLQIGTIASDSAAATDAVVNAILASPLADSAPVVLFSPEAPGLEHSLIRRSVRVEPYDYLVRDQTVQPFTAARIGRAFAPTDTISAAALMSSAYRHTTFLRPFVPTGDPAEWREYVAQLIATRGCGDFLSDASAVIDDDEPRTLRAALMATQLSDDTGHIAQVVVSPHARGAGLARQMLQHALAAMSARGLQRVSLLVARSNTAARSLYLDLGFKPAGVFLTGIR